MESLNLTVVTSGLVVLFITLTHQPPAETPGHSEGGASRKLVVWSHERGCCLAISNCARPDHEQDAGGAEICCRPDRRPGMTQDLAGAAPARGRSPAVDRVGSSKITFSTPRALSGRRSASHACGQRRRVVRRAESRRARCAAVAARWCGIEHSEHPMHKVDQEHLSWGRG